MNDKQNTYIKASQERADEVKARFVGVPPQPLIAVTFYGHLTGSATKPGKVAALITEHEVAVDSALAADISGADLAHMLRALFADHVEPWCEGLS